MGGGGWWVVAHKILVTSPEAKFLFSLFGAFWGFGLLTGPWPRACQFRCLQIKLKSIDLEQDMNI